MNPEIKEALEAIEALNDEFFAKLGNEDVLLSLSTTCVYTTIDIGIGTGEDYSMSSEIWNSEHDDRIYFEDSDSYESFYIFIRRRIKEIIELAESLKKVL